MELPDTMTVELTPSGCVATIAALQEQLTATLAAGDVPELADATQDALHEFNKLLIMHPDLRDPSGEGVT